MVKYRSRVALPLVILSAAIFLAACPNPSGGGGGGNGGGTDTVTGPGLFFWGSWLRMDGGNEVWYVASDGVAIGSAAKASATKVSDAGFSVSGNAVAKYTDDILKVTPDGTYSSFYLFRKAGATSSATLGIKGQAGARAISGLGNIRMIITNTLNAANSLDLRTGSDGNASLSNLIAGDTYEVTVPVQAGVAAAVNATVTPAFAGESLGFLTVGETKANYKVSCSVADGSAYQYAGTPFALEIAIENIGTESMLGANYAVSQPSGLSLAGAALSDILGSIAPNGGRKTLEFTCTAAAFADSSYSKVFVVPVHIESQDGAKVWDDQVSVRVYREALSLYLRSAASEAQGIVINPDRSSAAFKTVGRSAVATFPASDQQYYLSLSGADYTSETKYAVKLGADPGEDGTSLTNSRVNEPNDTAATATSLYKAEKKLGFLGVDDLDFYRLYSEYANGSAPPAPPGGFAATTGDGSVTLTWNDSTGATGYKVFYAQGSAATTASTPASGNPITGTSTTISSLQNNQTYAFIVVASNAAGDGLPSEVVTAKPGINVSAFSASIGSGTVKLVWPVYEGATGYNLYYRLGTSVTAANGTKVSVAEPTATVTGLTNGSKYAFIYAPTVGATEGTASPILLATPGTTPTQVAATTSGNTIKLAWTAVTGATSYNVYYRLGTTATISDTKLTASAIDGNAATVSGLDYGKQYAFVVTYVSGIESGASAVATAYTAPAAPTGLKSTAYSSGGTAFSIALTWTASVGASSYWVYWSNTPGVTVSNGTRIGASVSGAAYTHANLASAAKYYYIVTAVNSGGESAASAEYEGTTVTKPPTGLIPTGGDAQVGLSWSPVVGAVSYNLYWVTGDSGNFYIDATGVSKIAGVSSPYQHAGLGAGISYRYRLTAMNAGGESEASSVVTIATIPPTPILRSATSNFDYIILPWDAAAGATGYNLYWSKSPGVTRLNGTKVPVNSTAYQHSGLDLGTRYYYIVTALNASGESAPAAEVSYCTIPAAPTAAAAIGGKNQVSVTWTASTGASSYNLYWSTNSGITTSNGTKIAGATSPYLHASLQDGTSYYYLVTAVGPGGESAASSRADAMTMPATPTGFSVAPGNGLNTVSWTASTGAASYNLYWSSSPGVTTANGTKISGVASPYTHSGRNNGSAIYYILTAVNAGGESTPCAQASGTPALPTPTGLVATPGNRQVTVSWPSVPGASGYNLYWSASPGLTVTTGTKVAGAASPYTHTGRTNGTGYYYLVTAVDATSESTASAQANASPSGSFSYAVSSSGTVYAYCRDSATGALSQVSTAAASSGASSIVVTANGKFAFVSNYTGGGSFGSIYSYSVDAASGALSFLALYNTGVVNPRGLAIHPNGNFLYAAGSSGSLMIFSINNTTGALAPVSGSPFSTSNGAWWVSLSPSGSFGYSVIHQSPNSSVIVNSVNGGTGVFTPSVTQYVGASNANMLCVDPTGKFAYTTCEDGKLGAWTINASNGQLTAISGSPYTMMSPQMATVDPGGKFLFGAASYLYVYSLDAVTGALTSLYTYGGGLVSFSSCAMESTGNYLYAGTSANKVAAYSLNKTTGALTEIAGSPFAAGPNLLAIAHVNQP